MTKEELSSLTDIVSQIIERRRDRARISPAWVASKAMQALRAEWMSLPREGYPLVYLAAHLQLRQVARGLLRRQFEPEAEDYDAHPLFPGLQWRYPVRRANPHDEPQYELLELLKNADALYNIARLRTESEQKAAPADRLEDWRRARYGAVRSYEDV